MKQLLSILNLSLCLFILPGCYKLITPPSKWPIPFPSTITSVSPSHGPDSTLVTIAGYGFNATAANDSVFFNGRLAKVVTASDTQLVAVVPTLSGTGDVTIQTSGRTLTGGRFAYDTTYRVTMVADSLQAPFYLSLDATGNLIVPTYGDFLIHKITPQGVVSTWQPIPAVTGTVFDSAGNLYYASNAGGGPIFGKVSPAGVITQIAVDTGGGFAGQIALDRNGNIYVAIASSSATSKHRIDKITPGGNVSTLIEGLFNPSGIAVARDGTIYCTNYSIPAYSNTKGVVTKISPSGVVSTFAHFNYDGDAGITLDATTNTLYVTNFDQMWALGSVIRITPDGTTTKLASANLNFPCGLVRDKSGNFYVTQQADAPGSTVGSVVKMTMH